jgi:O-antigen/teichoic acid export membrane protein
LGRHPLTPARERVQKLTSASGRLSRRTVLAVLARAVSLAAAFGLSVIVARQLSVAEAGTFFICIAVTTLVSIAARAGVDTFLLREISGAGIDGPELRRLLLLSSALLAVAALATGAGAALLLPKHHGSTQIGASAALAVIVFMTGQSVILGAILRACERLTTGIIVEMGLAQGVAAILLLADLVAHDLTGALLGYTIGASIACLVGLVAVYHHFTPTPAGAVDTSRASAVTLFSMMATMALYYALPWAPLIVIGARASPEEAAYYAVALRMAGFMGVVPNIQVTYLAPIMAGLAHRGDVSGLSEQAGRAARWAALPALLLLLPLLFRSEDVLQLFGGTFTSHTPLVPASLGVFLPLLLGPINVVMLYCGHERMSSSLNLGLLVIMVAGVWAVAPATGASGASWVVACTTIGYAVIAAAYLKGHDGIDTTVLSRPTTAGTTPGQ